MSESTILINPNPTTEVISSPTAIVRIGTDVFVLGDGKLQEVEVTLAEGEAASTCSFTIYDPGRKYADKYFAFIERIGGLTAVTASKSADGTSSGSQSNGRYTGKLQGNLPAAIPSSISDRVKQALEFYLNHGFSNAGAAAIVGSMIQESSMNPGARATDQGVNNPSLGLIQWTGERANGLPRGDFGGQLEFALVEMDRDGGGRGLRTRLCDQSLSLSQLHTPVFNWIRWGDEGSRWTYADALLTYLNSQTPAATETPAKEAATSSVTAKPTQEKVTPVASDSGSQITIELGSNGQVYAQYSFLHTSLDFDLFAPDTLVFGGTAATWVLTQVLRSTAFTNLTFKQIAQRICTSYGLELRMTEDGPKYEYFPQRGISDYEALLTEARRIGYRVYCKGRVLTIQPRDATYKGFVLEYGDNMGLTFKVSHQAETGSSGGARSSQPGQTTTTGRKVILDPDTGEIKQVQPEVSIGAGQSAAATPTISTTGSSDPIAKPRTDGTDQKDQQAASNESRFKGITAEFAAPTSIGLLLLNPDEAFKTSLISDALDRFWVIDMLTHKINGSGFNTQGKIYSPMKSKVTEQASSSSAPGDVPPLNPGGFICPTTGVMTSGFHTARRPNHQGVDIAGSEGTPIWAAADGVVTDVQNSCRIGDISCGGGFGNRVYIQHSGGIVTIYAHMQTGSVTVNVGDQVKQSEVIGRQSDTGHSRGVHLHFQVELNGTPVNPLNYIKV